MSGPSYPPWASTIPSTACASGLFPFYSTALSGYTNCLWVHINQASDPQMHEKPEKGDCLSFFLFNFFSYLFSPLVTPRLIECIHSFLEEINMQLLQLFPILYLFRFYLEFHRGLRRLPHFSPFRFLVLFSPPRSGRRRETKKPSIPPVSRPLLAFCDSIQIQMEWPNTRPAEFSPDSASVPEHR